MTLKYAIDKINRLNDNIEKTRKIHDQLVTVVYNPNNTMKDSKTVNISLSKEEAKELCNILLDHIIYTDNMINELLKMDIPNV